MNPQIAALSERMGRGGNWREFRDEIASLHAGAATEEEYVALLEAHSNLAAVAKLAFNEATYAKLSPIVAAEYRSFLIKEATGIAGLTPTSLERIANREVLAGRLPPDDDFRELAAAGTAVFGDGEDCPTPANRNGDWFFYGAAAASVFSLGLGYASISPLWSIAVGLIGGYAVNERERRRRTAVKVKRVA